MTCINPKLDLGGKLSNLFQDIERKLDFGINQSHISGTNMRKMTCNNPKLDHVNMNVNIVC